MKALVLGVDHIMWAESLTAALQLLKIWDFKKGKNEVSESMWAVWSQFYCRWLFGCMTHKFTKSPCQPKPQRNTKEDNACHTLTGMRVMWRWLQFMCNWEKVFVWEGHPQRHGPNNCLPQPSVTSRSAGCHTGNVKKAAEFLCLAVCQADCAKVPASPVTVKQLMFMTSKSLPLPLLTRSHCISALDSQTEKDTNLPSCQCHSHTYTQQRINGSCCVYTVCVFPEQTMENITNDCNEINGC